MMMFMRMIMVVIMMMMTAKKGNNTLWKIGVHTKLLSTPSANGHWQEVTQQVFGENTICLDIGTGKKSYRQKRKQNVNKELFRQCWNIFKYIVQQRRSGSICFLCLEYKRNDILDIFEKFLGQNFKNPPLHAFERVCSHTHVIWETHFWEELIEGKRKCCCGGRFVGNELEEWPRVSFLSPWLPKLWDGNVFLVERIRK